MASAAPWILLLLAVMFCSAQAFSPLDPCFCSKDEIDRPKPSVPPQNIFKCFEQKLSQDCHHAFIIKTEKGVKCYKYSQGLVNKIKKLNITCNPTLSPAS